MNVYRMSARLQQLLDQDEYSIEECAELESLLGGIEDNCIERGKYIRNLEAEADAVDKAIADMQVRSTDLWANADKQRHKLAVLMQSSKIKSITKSPLFPLRFKENPISVDDYDRQSIPEDCWRNVVSESKKSDKEYVRKQIDSGVNIPGARLIRKLKVEFK